jgi:hypothetical protein
MTIDRINQGGGPAGISPTASDSVGEIAGPDDFSVGKVNKTSDVAATAPLERLKAGELDVDGYLNVRVEEATAHLAARLDPEQLAFIRSSLRAQLEQDPALVDLVRRATETATKSMERG